MTVPRAVRGGDRDFAIAAPGLRQDLERRAARRGDRRDPLLALLIGAASAAHAQTPLVYRISVSGTVENGLAPYVVRALGVEPLYSTAWQNDASRAVARTLGLVPVGRDLHIR